MWSNYVEIAALLHAFFRVGSHSRRLGRGHVALRSSRGHLSFFDERNGRTGSRRYTSCVGDEIRIAKSHEEAEAMHRAEIRAMTMVEKLAAVERIRERTFKLYGRSVDRLERVFVIGHRSQGALRDRGRSRGVGPWRADAGRVGDTLS